MLPMVASMTAFSRQASQKNDWGNLVWELRTVNHRFLDMNIRLPETLRALEPQVRERISEKCQRGKVEASLKWTVQQSALAINLESIRQLYSASEKIREYFPAAGVDVFSILSWPGVLETENKNQEIVTRETLELLEKALDDLTAMRRREGGQIKTFIEQRLDTILEIVADISRRIPDLLKAERGRMIKQLFELDLEINSQRLEQEMVLLIHKTDVEEEIQRLIGHCQAMKQSLEQTGSVGRRLDFLTQELHREANTLSSKALDLTLTHASVEMKVLIEQIREQVQNIE